MTNEEKLQRPNGCADIHLEYLDQLRESGVTNMFGAAGYLMREFGMGQPTAITILSYWMKSFGDAER